MKEQGVTDKDAKQQVYKCVGIEAWFLSWIGPGCAYLYSF